jgi:hypothetical protein
MRRLVVGGAIALLSTSGFAEAQTALTAADTSAIEALTAGYARALGACNAEQFADLFAPDTGYFASGFRGQIVGRERLIALVQSERHCNAPAGTAAATRPGNVPAIVVQNTADGVRGVADLGAVGQYQDEYVQTPQGWRFASRTVVVSAEKEAGVDARDMLAIRRLSGPELADHYVVNESGAKRLRSSGVAIGVTSGKVTGRAYLADGSYYDDVYEKTAGGWRIQSRAHVPAAGP